jgi:hypothetical protein
VRQLPHWRSVCEESGVELRIYTSFAHGLRKYATHTTSTAAVDAVDVKIIWDAAAHAMGAGSSHGSSRSSSSNERRSLVVTNDHFGPVLAAQASSVDHATMDAELPPVWRRALGAATLADLRVIPMPLPDSGLASESAIQVLAHLEQTRELRRLLYDFPEQHQQGGQSSFVCAARASIATPAMRNRPWSERVVKGGGEIGDENDNVNENNENDENDGSPQLTVTGRGASKAAAKHRAAEALLAKLRSANERAARNRGDGGSGFEFLSEVNGLEKEKAKEARD